MEKIKQKMKAKFSGKQQERLSEILGNISVAWFTAGVISPLFLTPLTVADLINRFIIPIAVSFIFVILSLKVNK